MNAIVAAAVTTVPGAKWAGISLIAGRDITAATSTADIMADIDQMQRDLDEGPCVSAIREHHTVLSNDLASDSRWPRFAIKAAERGVQSMLSFRLFVAAADLGALNLYGSAAGVFTTDSQIVGALFAQHAAVALAGSTLDDQLSDAIATRDVIGQAKGILMHRNGITGQQALPFWFTPPNTPRSSLWTSPAGQSRCTSRRCPNRLTHSGDIGHPVRRLLTRPGCFPRESR